MGTIEVGSLRECVQRREEELDGTVGLGWIGRSGKASLWLHCSESQLAQW